jgi:ABC-type glutathione transport system ATPase component
MSAPVWQLTDLHLTFRARGVGAPTPALRGASITVRAGERVAVIGESGSGKTTLARAGLGVLRPDAGSVELFGEDTARWTRSRWRRARQDVQLLFQDPRAMLNPGLSLGALLTESARLHRADTHPGPLVDRALHAVGLGDRHRARPHELSGGERRRAGLARVLMARPRLLVCDEPTAGLDAGLKADLVALILEQIGETCALVLISHDLPMVTWACERVVVMEAGEVVDRFRSLDLPHHVPHPRTAALLHAAGLRRDQAPAP